MKKYLTVAFLLIGLIGFSQRQTRDADRPNKVTTIKLFSGFGGFTAKMHYYDKHATMFFVSTENQQLFNKISKFSLSLEDMNKIYDLLLIRDANQDDSHTFNTLEQYSRVVISYKMIGRKSYGVLRLYLDEYDLKGARLSAMSKKNYKILFGKHKRTRN